ncbi:MAG: NUDIX hydrolase [Clostridia bacterium]|nr:NUDIX hydrolase [Clostridia bacterium]
MNKNTDFSISSAELASIEEKTISSKLIFDGKVIHLRLDDILLPDGNTGFREYCTHNGAVCVIPITSEGEVICVRQYRYAIGKPLIEIPAGKLDSIDENPDDAVRRELREETGAISGKLTFLGLYYGSPALLSEKIYMYLAEDLSFGDTDLDVDEFLEVVKIPLPTLVDMVLSGEIEDGKTQSAVLRASAMLSRGEK